VKGKIDRCHRQLGSRDSDIDDVWHLLSGWSTVPLITQYVKWLRAQIPEEPLCLTANQYTAHTATEIEEEAEELGIEGWNWVISTI
jgi:hypothetical protein